MLAERKKTSLKATINRGRYVHDYPAAKHFRRQRKEEAIGFISA